MAEVYEEIERSYDVGEEQSPPDLIGIGPIVSATEPRIDELDAHYLDTVDLALARRRTALRRRTGGKDDGWHAKLPGSEGRTELHWPLGEDAAPPAALIAELADAIAVLPEVGIPGVVDGSGTPAAATADGAPREPAPGASAPLELEPLARIRNRRATIEYFDVEGLVVAEFCDDRVRADDLRRGTERSWREWEVELGPAAGSDRAARTALLEALEAAVLAAGAHPAAVDSKLARALAR